MIKSKFLVIVKHFRKKPSRIIVWVSLVALVLAFLFPGIDLTPEKARAAAISIIESGNTIDTVDLIGDGSNNTYITLNGKEIALNNFLIDVDGYLLARYYTDRNRFPQGFEYVYVSYDLTTDQLNVDGALGSSRIQLDANKNLKISGGITYIEGSNSQALNLKSLIIDNGILTQMPANRDGLAAPYSRNKGWGVQFYGYYYLGPNRRASFFLTNNDNDYYTSLGLYMGKGMSLTPVTSSPDSPWGRRYNLSPFDISDPNQCLAEIFPGQNAWCSYRDGAGNWQTTVFTNSSAQGIFLPFVFFGVQDKDIDPGDVNEKNLVLSINVSEGPTSGGFDYDNQKLPVDKIVPAQADGTVDIPAGTLLSDPAFPNLANRAQVGMAYYYANYGLLNNPSEMEGAFGYRNVTPSGNFVLWTGSRSFQKNNIPLDQAGGLIDFGLTSRSVDFNGNSSQEFMFIWSEDGRSDVGGGGRKDMGNPIAFTQYEDGEDYLRAPLAPYVQTALVGQNGSARAARINLNVTDLVSLANNGQINVNGKGYPGGITVFTPGSVPYPAPAGNSLRYNTPDNPLHGGGYGGGPGDDNDAQSRAYSGSYGGSGVSAEYLKTGFDPNAVNNDDPVLLHSGQTYGGNEQVSQPMALGSGGGMFKGSTNLYASIGGGGGGAIHLKANDLSIASNGAIKASGGNGFLACAKAESQGIPGKPGSQKLGTNGCAGILNDDSALGTAGSGGSIWLEIANDFNNSGLIEARGAQGVIRADAADLTTDYNNRFNNGSVLVCANTVGADCRGPGAGGGRIAVQFKNNINKGTILALGGGAVIPDIYLQNANSPLGGDGTVVFGQLGSASTVFQAVDIDKSISRCDLPICADGDGDGNPDISTSNMNNASAAPGSWMYVTLKVKNNTTQVQNVTVTDELFNFIKTSSTPFAGITQVSPTNGTSINGGNEVQWLLTNIPPHPAAGSERVINYFFLVNI